MSRVRVIVPDPSFGASPPVFGRAEAVLGSRIGRKADRGAAGGP
jgi:hypothetical protein